MVRYSLITLFLLSFISISCNENSTANKAASSKKVPVGVKLQVKGAGVHEQTMTLENGTTLRFTISIPAGYASTKATPLVLTLHYGGRVTPFYGKGMIDELTGPGLQELNAIIVAPDSVGGDWTTGNNESAILQLIQSIKLSYNIDKKKTLITGFSMGGNGVWYIGGRNQDVFTAAIPVAGSPGTEQTWKIPVFAIHSKKDEEFPIGPVREKVVQLKVKGNKIEFLEIDGVTHYQVSGFVDALKTSVPWLKKIWKL